MSGHSFAIGAMCNVSESTSRGESGDTAVVFSHNGAQPNNNAEVWVFEDKSNAQEISTYALELERLGAGGTTFVQSKAARIAELKAAARKVLTGCSPRSFNSAWSNDYKSLFGENPDAMCMRMYA